MTSRVKTGGQGAAGSRKLQEDPQRTWHGECICRGLLLVGLWRKDARKVCCPALRNPWAPAQSCLLSPAPPQVLFSP